ncbi:DNA cytosine methyltransferase [Variovorax sp. LG9.2]|uniref:DNA cytosine methyltransferase n=1 Tax=Variovorax sp. LG9.2 TaxID=3048626 RepID=UPI002B23491E|nr:DNA cytosine methyltransferase [Variovorax sp. LG9.2]MEB0056716.1 DNA cytosine methyltransferase [Variovorax sp. LG9.2]
MNSELIEVYAYEGSKVVRKINAAYGVRSSAVENIADKNLSASAAWWQSFLRGAKVFPDASGATMPPLRSVDAFCGCGGLTLGAAQAAIATGRRLESVAAIDVDSGGLAVHQANFGTKLLMHTNASSLVDWRVRGEGESSCFAYEPEILDEELAAEIGKIDVFLAGPPCQGHSNLNNKTRREDPRNLLYITAVALGVGLRAKSIVMENVPEVVNDKSNVVNTAKALLKASGYEWIDSGVLATDHLGGAQTRKRYFLIASRIAVSESTVHIKDIAKALKQPPQPVSWAIHDLMRDPKELSVSIMDKTPIMSAENAARIQHLFEHDLYDLPDKERPDSHKNGNTYPSVYGRMHWGKPAQTITTGFLTPGRGRHIHPLRRRVISPHEAARIQTFPDTFNFVVDPQEPPSRTALQKWIGDAVPPLLGYAATLPLMLRM